MPNLNTGDLNRVMEMLDSRFYQIIDRVDGSYTDGGKIDSPKMREGGKRPRYIHSGLQQEQMLTAAQDLMRKGVL